jgi:hypothetical protein
VHAAAEGRFAVHPDGRREDAGVSPGLQRGG